jgi:hypothetical protein
MVSPAVDDPIIVDGHVSEWESLPFSYMETSLRVFAATHDEHTLYLMFRFSDERLARGLLARGVILWFNGNGKTKNKNEAFGLRYNGSEDVASYLEEEAPDPSEAEPDPRRERMMRTISHLRTEPGELTIIRFGVKEVVPEGLTSGPAAASAVDDGVFIYEVSVPLMDIGGKVADAPATKKRRVAVGIQIGGTTEAERESIVDALEDSIGRTGGFAGGTRGGSPGGGSGGGGFGGRGGGGGMGGMGGGTGGRPPQGEGGPPKSRLDPRIEWVILELNPAP